LSQGITGRDVVILSEVIEAIKCESKRERHCFTVALFFGLILALLPPFASAEEKKISLDQLSDCNWMVTYRGRTYDLSPLTREALARPIESDIRYALQRVPAANDHLNAMSTHLRDARAHTIFASIFLGGFIATRIIRSSQKNENYRQDYDVASAATGLFFLASTAFSWKSTRDAKDELVKSVEAFNEGSPHKIEPAAEGQALMGQ
jgi:hypothetical protein